MHVYIPVIAYNQNVNGHFTMALIELIILLKSKNINVSVEPFFFESLITRARNAAASRFLDNPDMSHLLFIDTDIMFKPSDVLLLLESNKPIIGAAYPKKYVKQRTEYPVDFTINGSIMKNSTCPEKYIYEAQYIPTGFICITKDALMKIKDKRPDIKYINNIDGYTTKTNEFYNFFQCIVDNETNYYLSEDFSFCKMCKECNISVYIYSNITLRHIGWYMYEGNLQEYIDIKQK